MIISLDVGATKIICALIDNNYRILKKIKVASQIKKGKYFVLQNISDTIKKIWREDVYPVRYLQSNKVNPNRCLLSNGVNPVKYLLSNGVKKICIGFAGKINSKKGIIIRETNFFGDFKNTPLKKNLEKEFRVPVFLSNDAQCFTLGENIFGAGKNFNAVLGLTLGTGIGVGMSINKKIYYGAHYLISELAHHIIVEKNGLKCHCKNRGCFEAVASGTALEKYYKILTKKKKTGKEIIKEALENKKPAQKAILKIAKNLGIGLAYFINILDPNIVILGGGLSEVDMLYKPTINEMKKHLMDKSLFKIPVIKSKLGENAIILGASMLGS